MPSLPASLAGEPALPSQSMHRYRQGCLQCRIEAQSEEDDAIAATAAAYQSFDGILSVCFLCGNSELRPKAQPLDHGTLQKLACASLN